MCVVTAKIQNLDINGTPLNIDAEASQRVRELTEAFARAEGITEQLKAENSLMWVQEMHNCKARAEEIVLREVVFR